MRKSPTDYWLWLAVSGGLFGSLAVVWVALAVDWARPRFGDMAADLVGLAAGCGLVGWFAQAIAVDCGVRSAGPPRTEQAADYDDAPPPPPAG